MYMQERTCQDVDTWHCAGLCPTTALPAETPAPSEGPWTLPGIPSVERTTLAAFILWICCAELLLGSQWDHTVFCLVSASPGMASACGATMAKPAMIDSSFALPVGAPAWSEAVCMPPSLSALCCVHIYECPSRCEMARQTVEEMTPPLSPGPHLPAR